MNTKLSDITVNQEYVFTKIPRKNAILQILLRNTLFMASPLGKYLIQFYSPNLCNFSYIPGFIMLYGNIAGNNVGLCDVFCVDYAPIILGNNVRFSFRNLLLTSSHDEINFSIVKARPIIIKDNV